MLYQAPWRKGRVVTQKAFTRRLRVEAKGAAPTNTDDPVEALRIARLYANTGMTVYVFDRASRTYLDEAALERLASGEADNA